MIPLSNFVLRAKGLTALGILLTVFACVGANVSKQNIQGIDNEIELGFENITKYNDALYRLGQMLDAYGCPTTLIQVRGIYNRTASQKLPADVSQMSITALNKIGKHLQIVDYDQDQLGIDLAIGTHTMERIVPELALRGAITEFDKKIEKERDLGLDLSSKTFGAGTDAGIDGNYDTSAAGTTAAMDFQLIDYKTQTLLPGIQAANRVNLYENSKGGGLRLTFVGSGADLNTKVKRTQGLHASLRLLVELSIAELIGKYSMVPYWRCIPNAEPDPVTVRNYEARVASQQNPLQVMKKLAVAHGYSVDPFSAQLSASEAEAFTQLREQLHVSPTASDADFITALWLSVPIEQGAENMRNYYVQKEQEAFAKQQELAKQQQLEQQRMAEAQEMEAQKQNKRTTFKFGTQDHF